MRFSSRSLLSNTFEVLINESCDVVENVDFLLSSKEPGYPGVIGIDVFSEFVPFEERLTCDAGLYCEVVVASLIVTSCLRKLLFFEWSGVTGYACDIGET